MEPSSTTTAEETRESTKAEKPSGEAHTDSQAEREDAQDGLAIQAVQNIRAENKLFTERYFKAGEYGSDIFFYPSLEGLESDYLECTFHTRDDNYFRVFNQTGESGILTESQTTSYEILVEQYSGAESAATDTYQLTFHLHDTSNPHISVDGPRNLAGDYYPFSETFDIPDIFIRYLSKADLWSMPTEDLWLLRNQVYAAHGRRFNSEVLNDYFAKQNWYRGHIEPEDFSDSVLSEVEKNNIALILERDPNAADLNTAYGYFLYQEGTVPSEGGIEAGLSLDYTTGTWQLWQASADTVMKTVYSGDIYIMKGAVEGFDTGIEGASRHQKEIVPSNIGRERDELASDRIVGNCLRYNGKGHITAVYYLGD